jgi:tetratricopeptide (TPR) repeat protein
LLAAERQPTAAEWNRTGVEWLEKGEAARALLAFQKAARLKPDDPAIAFNVGLSLFRLGRYREALAPLAKALEHPPSAAQARYLRGVIHFELRDFAACAQELESLRGDARYGEHVLYMLVESYRNLNDAGRSQQAFAELNARFPDSAFLHKLMGMAHEWQGNDSKAIEEFQSALRVNPRMPEMAFAVGYIYFKQGRRDEARSWFAKELALDPCSAKTHHYLGEIAFAEEKLDEAAESYRKAIACEARFTDSFIGLGMVSERRGDLTQAIQFYRQAVRLQPDDAQARFKLGSALRRTGRQQEAEAELAAARRLFEQQARSKPRERR